MVKTTDLIKQLVFQNTELKMSYRSHLEMAEICLRKTNRNLAIIKMLDGRGGYLQVTQGTMPITSGFHTIEDIFKFIVDDNSVWAYEEKPMTGFGRMTFRCAENGILHLDEWNVDSTD